MTPRRSALFMPAHNERAITKARTLDCDVVILDLEDAVAPDTKQRARNTAKAAVLDGGFDPREIAVRVNGIGTEWHTDDMTTFADSPLDALVVPKAESPADIKRLGERMDALGYSPDVELWLMAETPTGVFNARELCQAHERVGALLMGTSDLSQCLRIPATIEREGLVYALSHCVLAAREANIDVLDGVCLDLANPEIYQVQCEQGRELGFDGKTLIHPSQITIANAVFAPSDHDIERANNIITAWNEALARGDGLCVLDGKLVENLHANEASRTIALHEAIQARLL
ncbi:MAG: HpcH/HpaI aldolase/citrate lyase family protein [Litorivicinaceae bacterium]